MQDNAIGMLVAEAEARIQDVYFTASLHNVYLSKPPPDLDAGHVYNKQIASSKGCITTDQLPEKSGLKVIYSASVFLAIHRNDCW